MYLITAPLFAYFNPTPCVNSTVEKRHRVKKSSYVLVSVKKSHKIGEKESITFVSIVQGKLLILNRILIKTNEEVRGKNNL
jgi:hypothetical protein